MQDLYSAWCFFLPASAVSFGLYGLWLIFGQESILAIDLKLRCEKKSLLGSGRGLKGMGCAIVIGAFCGVLQGRGDDALYLALGAWTGCLVNSFIKRRLGYERGESFPLLDHIDFVLGASWAYWLHAPLCPKLFILGLLVCGLAHYILGHLVLRRLLRWAEPSKSKPCQKL